MGEVWPSSSDEHLNCNNDQYSDNDNKFMDCQQHYNQSMDYQPYFEGYVPTNPETPMQMMSSSDEQTDGSSDTASCSASGSRRVMREIIV